MPKIIADRVRYKIFARDDWKCQFCGEDNEASLRIDHFVPRIKGGSDDESNLWTLCVRCNGIKYTRIPPFQIGFPQGGLKVRCYAKH